MIVLLVGVWVIRVALKRVQKILIDDCFYYYKK